MQAPRFYAMMLAIGGEVESPREQMEQALTSHARMAAYREQRAAREAARAQG